MVSLLATGTCYSRVDCAERIGTVEPVSRSTLILCTYSPKWIIMVVTGMGPLLDKGNRSEDLTLYFWVAVFLEGLPSS